MLVVLVIIIVIMILIIVLIITIIKILTFETHPIQMGNMMDDAVGLLVGPEFVRSGGGGSGGGASEGRTGTAATPGSIKNNKSAKTTAADVAHAAASAAAANAAANVTAGSRLGQQVGGGRGGGDAAAGAMRPDEVSIELLIEVEHSTPRIFIGETESCFLKASPPN